MMEKKEHHDGQAMYRSRNMTMLCKQCTRFLVEERGVQVTLRSQVSFAHKNHATRDPCVSMEELFHIVGLQCSKQLNRHQLLTSWSFKGVC